MATDRREDILEATLRQVAKGGVDAVRYRDVAELAKVPLGTVSYHFPSREALLRAAFAWFLDDNTRALFALRTRFAARKLDDVADYLVEIVATDARDPRRRALAEYELIVYAARDPEVAEALGAWQRAMAAELAPVLERLSVPGPYAAAQTLIDLVRGLQLVHLGRKADLEDFRRRARDVVRALHGPHPQGKKKSHEAR